MRRKEKKKGRKKEMEMRYGALRELKPIEAC